jgi:hypothetical protein
LGAVIPLAPAADTVSITVMEETMWLTGCIDVATIS